MRQQHMGIHARHDPDFNSIKAKPPDMNENTCYSLSLSFTPSVLEILNKHEIYSAEI